MDLAVALEPQCDDISLDVGVSRSGVMLLRKTGPLLGMSE